MLNLQHAHDDMHPVMCFLIVEDDATLGPLLVEAIQDEMNAQILLASSGEHALSLLQTSEPTLCLLDYHLPGMNGLELAARLRSRAGSEQLPIVLMSAALPHEDEIKDHLRMLKKPFGLETLLHMITELLCL